MLDGVVRASADDRLEDAFDVRHEVFVEGQGVPVDLERDDRDDQPSTLHFVAYDEGRPVGAARLCPAGDGVGKVQRVAVREPDRGRGWGHRLMAALEDAARGAGYDRLELDAQTHAVAFYERLGYEVTSDEVFTDAGIPHLSMAKDL
ncbi:GNAT family N-acetyltransferase [Halobacteriales archaeon QS_5_70_17]|nr:MAG: GNAT family N-acetyltransferase [Halobacteriales archaeon QS_5_70_17]